jgi:hypothetical protein
VDNTLPFTFVGSCTSYGLRHNYLILRVDSMAEKEKMLNAKRSCKESAWKKVTAT